MIHSDAELLLAAGAVLDDLEPDERAAYEAHRGGCLDCRRLELELDHVLADLALVVPERVPPPDLLGGIRRALAAEAPAGATGAAAGAMTAAPRAMPMPPPARATAGDAVDALGTVDAAVAGSTTRAASATPSAAPANVVPLRRPTRTPLYASLGLAAVLGIVAVGLGARSVGLQQDLDRTTARATALEASLTAQADAMTVAMNPSHVTVALHAEPVAPDAEAMVVFVPGQRSSWIVARNLPATPSGHGYQLWYADAAGVHPLQTVAYDGSGTFVASIGVDLADSKAVMITLEDAGGATGEPGPQVVFGEL